MGGGEGMVLGPPLNEFLDPPPQLDVELSCVAIDTLTDATQLSPTIGNGTDPVEQRTAKSVVFLFMTSRPTN